MTFADKFIRRAEPVLARVLAAVRVAETFLGPEDDWVERDRRILYEAADKFLRPLGRPTIRRKGTADYVTTVDASPDEVEEAIMPKYQRNVLSTRKYRTDHDGGRQWAVGSFVYDPADEPWQHHVYLFPGPNGGTDVYAHKEASVRNPSEHHGSWQKHGDPDGLLRTRLDERGLDYTERKL